MSTNTAFWNSFHAGISSYLNSFQPEIRLATEQKMKVNKIMNQAEKIFPHQLPGHSESFLFNTVEALGIQYHQVRIYTNGNAVGLRDHRSDPSGQDSLYFYEAATASIHLVGTVWDAWDLVF